MLLLLTKAEMLCIELVITVQGISGINCAKCQLLELASKPITAHQKHTPLPARQWNVSPHIGSLSHLKRTANIFPFLTNRPTMYAMYQAFFRQCGQITSLLVSKLQNVAPVRYSIALPVALIICIIKSSRTHNSSPKKTVNSHFKNIIGILFHKAKVLIFHRTFSTSANLYNTRNHTQTRGTIYDYRNGRRGNDWREYRESIKRYGT